MSHTFHHRTQHHQKWRRPAPRWFTNMVIRVAQRQDSRIALDHYVRGGEDPVLPKGNRPNADWDWT